MARIVALCGSALLACATALTVLASPAVAQGADVVAPVANQVTPGDEASPAAAQQPTLRELLQACGTKTDVCKFHPNGAPKFFLGNRNRVSKVLNNCTGTSQSEGVTWSKTVSSSNSVGVAVTTSVSFEKVFEVSVQTSYTYTWDVAHTFAQTTTLNVPKSNKGWIVLAAPMARVTGQYELHFGDRFYGHYIWYVNNYTETGPRNGAKGQIISKTVPMTAQEHKQICGK